MSGVIGGLVAGAAMLLFRMAARNARASFDGASGTHVGRYPLIARAFTWLLMLVPVGLWIALLKVTPADQLVVGSCVCSVLTIVALSLLLEFNFARVTWSESGLVFHSPWTKVKKIEWRDITQVHFSVAANWLVISGREGARIRISSLLGGLRDLFQTLHANAAPALGADLEQAFSRWRHRGARQSGA
jgi:hypothetical protein